MIAMHGIPQEIYNDHRFIDIGDLPTGFGPYKAHGVSKIFARPFCVRELSLLYLGANVQYDGVTHIIRAVDMAISCDANILTDGDFEYIMTWLRMNSYPKAPSLVTWECKKVNVIHKQGRDFYKGDDAESLTAREMEIRGLEHEVCDTENNEIVHGAQTIIHTLDDNDTEMEYSDLDFPRVATLPELYRIKAEQPDLVYQAQIARWVKEGSTLEEKMKALNEAPSLDQYNRILECTKRYKHGISEKMKLRCRGCGNTLQHTAYPDPMTFFADNSEQNILDIQYALLSELNMQPDDDMPAKTLLYHYSCLAKDKQAEEERRRIQKAVRGGR